MQKSTQSSEERAVAQLEVLGIIPARGGSKSIPNKNIALLAGKPLISWTIQFAKQAQLLSRLVVSTDDAQIAEIAQQSGAEIIERPAELSTDHVHTEPVLLHALDYLEEKEGYVPDAVALLQCTSPMRGSGIIDAGIRKLAETGCDAVLSVQPIQHWDKMGTIGPGDVWKPEYDYAARKFTHEVVDKYSENGALFVTRTAILRQYQNRLGGDVRVAYPKALPGCWPTIGACLGDVVHANTAQCIPIGDRRVGSGQPTYIGPRQVSTTMVIRKQPKS